MYNELFEKLTEEKVLNYLELDFRLENRTWKGQCPKKHSSQSGKSFQVGNKKFHCWNCGIGGNLIHLIELIKFGTISKKHFSENYSQARDLACDLTQTRRFLHSDLSQQEILQLEKEQREQEIIEEILTRITELTHKNLLKKDEKKIKERIDLSLDIIKKFKIGYCYKNLLKDLRKEFEIKDIALTGFISKFDTGWKLLFKNRFLFPYIKNGQTVYFSGRVKIGETTKTKYKKLPIWNIKNFPYVSKYLRSDVFFNEDFLKGVTELIITEGLTDGIFTGEQGINFLSCGGINLNEIRHKRLFQITNDIPNIYLCFDTEESLAGLNAAKKIALYFLQNKKEIKIIELPSLKKHFDLKDFFKERKQEDFGKEKNKSKTLIELEINKIDPRIERTELIFKIRPVLKLLSYLDYITANNYLNYLLKTTFKLKISDIQGFRTEIKRLQKDETKNKKCENLKILSSSGLRILNQGLDFMDSTLYYTIFDQQLEEFTNSETGNVSVRLIHTPYLVTSKKEYIKATPELLLKDKLFFSRELFLDFNLVNKWSIQEGEYSITKFLSGTKTIDTKNLFQTIKNYFDNYIVFPKKITSIHFVLVVMASYLLAVFDTIGYVHLFAEKRSGKTRLLEVLEGLGFNAVMSSSISDSSIFRIIEASRCLLLTDEAENLDPNYKAQQNSPSERLQLLNSGYKKSGAAIRIEKTDNKLIPMKFSTFCIKIFAGTQEINPLLQDRTITYLLKRVEGKRVKHFIPSALQEEWKNVRDQLYFWAMENAARISEIYRNELPIIYKDVFEEHKIVSREYELWSPYFAIAKCVDEKTDNIFNIFNSLLTITRNVLLYKRYTESDSWTNRLVVYIYDFASQNKTDDDFYNLTDMVNFIKAFENFEYLTTHRLVKHLYGKLCLSKPQDRKRIRREGENIKDIWIKIPWKNLEAIIKRHEIILDNYIAKNKEDKNEN